MEENALLVTVDQLCNHFYMAKEFSAIHVDSPRRQLITGKQIQQGHPKFSSPITRQAQNKRIGVPLSADQTQ